MSFHTIVGQDKRIAILQRSLAAGRLAHAYLFEGIEGCGKKTTAIALIKAVFCAENSGCGSCPSCRKIAALQHPDLHIIEPDGAFIKIDQIRELQKELAYRPFEAPKKACIIDGADRLNQSSGNALLKTLEEPSGNALIILITSQTSLVLPTIISRCQRLLFPGLAEETITTYLTHNGIDDETAAISASLAGGSMKKALEISRGSGLAERKQLLSRILNLSVGDITPLFFAAEEIAADKEKSVELLEMLRSFFRDVLLFKSGASEVINDDLLMLIKEKAHLFSPAAILEKLEHITGARSALSRNVNTRLALEVLFMRLAQQ